MRSVKDIQDNLLAALGNPSEFERVAISTWLWEAYKLGKKSRPTLVERGLLSRRDKFAIAALEGLLANDGFNYKYSDLIVDAVAIADQLIEKLDEEKK